MNVRLVCKPMSRSALDLGLNWLYFFHLEFIVPTKGAAKAVDGAASEIKLIRHFLVCQMFQHVTKHLFPFLILPLLLLLCCFFSLLHAELYPELILSDQRFDAVPLQNRPSPSNRMLSGYSFADMVVPPAPIVWAQLILHTRRSKSQKLCSAGSFRRRVSLR